MVNRQSRFQDTQQKISTLLFIWQSRLQDTSFRRLDFVTIGYLQLIIYICTIKTHVYANISPALSKANTNIYNTYQRCHIRHSLGHHIINNDEILKDLLTDGSTISFRALWDGQATQLAHSRRSTNYIYRQIYQRHKAIFKIYHLSLSVYVT